MEVRLFTDGSSLGNPGPGGFCAIAEVKGLGSAVGKKFIIKGGDPHATNNRMEMSAVIAGLYWVHKKFPEIKRCQVFSDSQLVTSTLKHGWKRKKNKDLWEKLDRLIGKFDRLEWHWIRGHAGHPENTKADRIAVAEAKKRRPKT